MAVKVTVNGIDAEALHQTVQQLGEHPEGAAVTLRAHNKWIDGAHARTLIRDFSLGGQEDESRAGTHELHGDEPAPLLGTDLGANATEALLHGLACCLNATFIYHAAAMGIEVEELELELEGDLDLRGFLAIAKVPVGFQEIRVTFRVKADAPEGRIKALVDLAQRHSPVFNSVTTPVPVVADYEVLA